LLKKVGEGYSKTEVVKHLQEKFGISRSGAYYYFNNRGRWLGEYSNLFQVEELQFQVFNRFNYIYREAAFQFLHTQNDNARIGYLRTMLDANEHLSEFVPEGMKQSEPTGYVVTWKEPDWLKNYTEIATSASNGFGKNDLFMDGRLTDLTDEEREKINAACRILNKKRGGGETK
jgi:hypothetical protein